MELFQFYEDDIEAWGFRGDGIYQDRTPDGELMTQEQAAALMAEIQQRL